MSFLNIFLLLFFTTTHSISPAVPQYTPQQAIDYINYLADSIVKFHPVGSGGILPNDLQKTINDLKTQYQKGDPTRLFSAVDLFFQFEKIFVSLGDPESGLFWEKNATLESPLRVISLPFMILYSVDLDMIITENTTFASAGNTIISWNGKTTYSIINSMVSIIPHSNLHYLRAMIPQLLVMEPYLSYLGLINQDGVVPITILNEYSDNGRPPQYTFSLSLQNISNITSPHSKISASYPNSDTAILKLNNTYWDDNSFMSLWKIISKVKTDRRSKFVIDVRNTDKLESSPLTVSLAFAMLYGGTFVHYGLKLRSTAVSNFEQYFPEINETKVINFLQRKGIDISGNLWSIPGQSLADLIRESYLISTEPYNCQMIVFIGPNTQGPANLFAKIITDSLYGIKLGTPTGFNLNFYGMPITLQFSEIENFSFRLSTAEYETDFSSDNKGIVPTTFVIETKSDIHSSSDRALKFVIDFPDLCPTP